MQQHLGRGVVIRFSKEQPISYLIDKLTAIVDEHPHSRLEIVGIANENLSLLVYDCPPGAVQ